MSLQPRRRSALNPTASTFTSAFSDLRILKPSAQSFVPLDISKRTFHRFTKLPDKLQLEVLSHALHNFKRPVTPLIYDTSRQGVIVIARWNRKFKGMAYQLCYRANMFKLVGCSKPSSQAPGMRYPLAFVSSYIRKLEVDVPPFRYMGRFPSVPRLFRISEGLQHLFDDRTRIRKKIAWQASFDSLTHLRITIVASNCFSAALNHVLEDLRRHATISIRPQKVQVVVYGLQGVWSDGWFAPLLGEIVGSMVGLRPKSVEL
jgi:hypothetical protein